MGACVAWGLARQGLRVCVLDEGDIALRASRANFALIWVQGKGIGFPAYAAWTKAAAEAWPRLAAELRSETGINVGLDQPGGFTLCLSDRELQVNVDAMARLHNQPDTVTYPYEILDHAQTKARLPAIGPDVSGSIYCPLDGHVNSLRLFRALHAALKARSVDYRADHAVTVIEPRAGGFALTGAWGEIESCKSRSRRGTRQCAAGADGGARGSDEAEPRTDHRHREGRSFPALSRVTVRQTDEGGVMIGDSEEADGLASGSIIPSPPLWPIGPSGCSLCSAT